MKMNSMGVGEKLGIELPSIGVCWRKKENRWEASSSYKGKIYRLGTTKEKEEACKLYDEFIEKIDLEHRRYSIITNKWLKECWEKGLVPLTRGQVAIVDEDDYVRVMEYKWYANEVKDVGEYYANSRLGKGSGKEIGMHRFIMNCYDSALLVDHINGNRLDNRKTNLRIVDLSANNRNKINQVLKTLNTTGIVYPGVNFNTVGSKATWRSKRYFDQRSRVFNNDLEAAAWYSIAVIDNNDVYTPTAVSMGLISESQARKIYTSILKSDKELIIKKERERKIKIQEDLKWKAGQKERMSLAAQTRVRKIRTGKSATPFKGVTFLKIDSQGREIYEACFYYLGKYNYIGRYRDPVEAAKAYDKKVIEIHGDKAMTNSKLGLI